MSGSVTVPIQLAYQRDTATGQILFSAEGYPQFATNAGANTYGNLQARVQNEVLGSPTATDIQNAIQDAILEYERESFWFNDMRYFGDVTGSNSDLQTVNGQEFYSYADLPVLISMPHLSKILVLAFSNRYPLVQRTKQWIDDQSLSTSWQGLPTDWCWQSGSLRLYPVPNGGYPLILDGTVRFAPLVNSGDYNCWTNEAERLIRIEAKRLLFRDIIRDADQVAAMEMELMGNPQTGRQGALAMLRRETTRRAGGTGKLRPSRGYF
jgi:hypothetical protein